jgi:gamma-resorcylate decarboxylase
VSGLIAVEEHFLPADETLPASVLPDPARLELVEARLKASVPERLAEMNRCGIERVVLSLTSPGVQDEPLLDRAVVRAAAANTELAEIVAAAPDRFAGLAALPMQDPERACSELERAVRTLGLRGVLVNGYSAVGALVTPAYYDQPAYLPFWQLLAELDVPFYLHPRNPLPDQQRIYAGREELLGATWAFTVETATHALRLLTSGLLDRLPSLKLVLGHLGELLPFAVDRVQRGFARDPHARTAHTLPHYVRENMFVTTSGAFNSLLFRTCIELVGAEHVLFATDSPYDEMAEAVEWFVSAPIDDSLRVQIGRSNAQHLFNL